MVDTTKESTCYPVNSNDEIVLVDGVGNNTVVAHLPNEWIPVDPSTKRMKVVLPDNISRISTGFMDYADAATASSPIQVVANTPKKLTCDGLGSQTLKTYKTPYITELWNASTNQFNLSDFQIGDMVDLRIGIEITTTAINQEIEIYMKLGVGDPNTYNLTVSAPFQYKSTGSYTIYNYPMLYIGNTLTKDNPAEIWIVSDHNATVKVFGWYIKYDLQQRAAT